MARKDSLPGQRYACDRPGCDKNYSRPDHLLRHKLNHDREKVLQCDQCDRTFVRQDLLARHLERHAVRGKTLGRWSGRQKSISGEGSSKDMKMMEGEDDESDGAESSRGNHQSYSHQNQNQNQYYSGHHFDRESEMQNSLRQRNSLADVGMLPTVDRYDTPFAYAPPPQGSSTAGITQGYGYRDAMGGQTGSSNNQMNASGSLAPYSTHSFSNPGNPAQAASIGPPLPYDVLEQQPHPYNQSPSGRTYNYPRQSNSRNGGRSSWDIHGASGQGQSIPSPSTTFGGTNGSGTANWVQNAYLSSTSNVNEPGAGEVMNFSSANTNSNEQMTNAFAGSLPEATALLHSAVSGSSHFPFSAPTADDYMADYGWLFDGSNPVFTGTGGDEMASSLSEASTNRETQATDDGHDQNGGGEDGQSDLSPTQPLEQADALHDLAFFAILQRDIPDEAAFEVDSQTHSRLLHFLSSVPELSTSPLFTPSALRCYIYLYFTKFNTIYPLIHRPTFSSKIADPMLLSAMIVNGAHFADEAAHFLAERIGRKLWGAFITFEDFRPARATLALLQAMLLTEAFGKMMGTRPQHETAHLFHNFIVTLARRNAVFVPTKVKLPHTSAEDRWRAWSKEEEKKRISLFAFILDAQHATIFRHIPALSSFQIHLQLPCEEDEWEASTAQEWTTIRQNKRREPPYFIAALKATLTPGNDLPISTSDSFQHFVLLHGLMSVAYDLQWKQQALLAAPDTNESISNWKERLMQSYKRFMDRYESKRSNRIMERASHSLIEWAQVTLHADAVEIQIYAGLPTVMGRFIDHHTFSVARKSCREWGRSEDARIAVWHASRFLRETLFPNLSMADQDQDVSAAAGAVVDRPLHTGFDELLHHQWVQYVCALIIWAYEQAVSPLRGNFANSRPRSQDQESNASSGNAVNTALSGPNTSLQSKNVSNHSVTTQPVPTITTPLDKAIRDANSYLSDVIASDTRSSISFDPPHHLFTAVLELVERDCRGSRWELGREASGVLRKLIRERNAASIPSAGFASLSG